MIDRRRAVLLGLAIAAAPPARAEERPAPPPGAGVARPEIQVVATPIVEDNEVRYGSLVTVVGARQIEDLNAQDLPNALRMTPGVVISRFNPVGSFGGSEGGSIYIHGHGTGRPGAEISTLFDGVPRFSGVWTHPLMDILPIETAGRVEVYKGAQPVLLGNMGFAAVNLVPKRRAEEGFETRLDAAYGSYNTDILGLEHGGRVGDFDYYLVGCHRQSDGRRPNADGVVDDLYGRVGYRLGDHWDLSFQVLRTGANVGDPQAEGTPPPPRKERFITDDKLYLLTASHHYDTVEGSVKLFYDDGYINWQQYDTEPFDGITSFDNYGVRIREALHFVKGNEILLGFDRDNYGGSYRERRPSGTGTDVANFFYTNSPYLMLSQTMPLGGVDITPSAGVRYFDTRFFDDGWGYQGGLTADFKTTKVWTGYAHTLNYPGVYAVVMYSGWPNPDGWRALEPEIMDHVEVGASHAITSKVRADVTLFNDRVRNAIRFAVPPPRFVNTDYYIARGVEASVRAEPLDRLELFAGGAYTDTVPNRVPDAPRWSLSAGVGYRIDRWKFGLDAQFVDDRFVQNPRFAPVGTKVGDYYLINVHVGYFVLEKSELYLAIENLTNKQYEFLPGYPMPGTNWMLGTHITF
jgi:iron complex outermembrane receptor protein